MDRLTAEMGSISGQIAEIEQQEKQRDQLREEETHLKADCRTLMNNGKEIKEKTAYLQEHQGGICPTCGQEMDQEHCLKHIEDLVSRLNELRAEYREKDQKAKRIEDQLQELNRKISELGRLRARHNGLTGEIAGTGQKIKMIEDSIADWETGKKSRLEALEKILRDADFCAGEREELKDVTDKIGSLNYDERAHEAVRGQMKELAGAEEAYQRLLNDLSRIEPLEREIREKTEKLNDEKQQLDILQKRSPNPANLSPAAVK